MGWKTIKVRESVLKRIEEKAKERGEPKSKVINRALEFLLLMGFFEYGNPLEWLEAKVEELCGEFEEEEIREEVPVSTKVEEPLEAVGTQGEVKEEVKEEPKTLPKEEEKEQKQEQEERIGIDVPIWGSEEEPQKEKSFEEVSLDDDEEWTITF